MGYQIDEITYAKSGGTLSAQKGGCGKDQKIGHKIRIC